MLVWWEKIIIEKKLVDEIKLINIIFLLSALIRFQILIFLKKLWMIYFVVSLSKSIGDLLQFFCWQVSLSGHNRRNIRPLLIKEKSIRKR
jgi:hypothetical protein